MNGIFKIDLNVLRRGDKTIWGVVALLLGFALLGVISTSTISEVKSISSVFLIFARDVLVGVVAMLAACWLDYRCYRGITWIALVLSIVGLAWAFLSGTRWISLFGASLQPSAFALIAMVMFTARYLEKYNRDPESMLSWRRLIFDLWGPVLVMAFLITFYNLSTGLIFMFTFYVVLLIGRYPVRHILVTIGAFIVMAGGLYGLYKAKPEAFEGTRMETWVARLERFFKKDETLDIAAINKMSPAQREDYNRRKKEDADKRMQENAARTAIALGGVLPSAGPGKSIQKYFLSEADSDFIFSILVEEYSFIGGAFILLLFVLLAIRVTIQAFKVEDMFGMLVLCGLLCVMMSQAVVHTGVNVGMIPLTGQNLPFISSGGTSIITSCLMIGIIQKIIMNSQQAAEARKTVQPVMREEEKPEEERDDAQTE